MWWCPTGPFSFLPIHAAGIYKTERAKSVSDYVISSYTPSLRPLLGNQPSVYDQFKMVAVIEPDFPRENPLHFTREELHSIESHVKSDVLTRLGIEGHPATVKDVLSHLSGSQIVHFACHGKQDAKLPLESGLILHNANRLKISDIMKQRPPNASLAFLSACETAMGAENLPDEAMHLAATLLFAGFRGVVATMWLVSSPHF
jgi:CHAT domain-containing protein